MPYEFENENETIVHIKVVGVGGGGGNAIDRMVEYVSGVEFISVNTDKQALNRSKANQKVQIGEKITHGKGAGSKPEVGEKAAEENKDVIAELLKDTDMVFITAGMGGGTGTGAAPVIAEIARELNKLTIGVVTKPFKFEGIKKMDRAEKGIEALKQNVDALIVIPNQNLIDTDMKNLTMAQAYAISDNVLKTDVIAIAEIITRHDEINVDFADVTTILTNAGQAHIAIGHGEGKDKVQDILNQVVTSRLLETSIAGARRLIVNVTMSPDLTVLDMAELTEAISNAADDGADIIFGNGTDENAKDTMDVTVIAADFTDNAAPVEEAKPVNPFAKFAPKPADTEAKAEAKADAEAMQKAGVKAADNPNYYDDIFNIFQK